MYNTLGATYQIMKFEHSYIWLLTQTVDFYSTTTEMHQTSINSWQLLFRK